MEQLPSEFEGSRICYYDRRASVGQKIFKAISCQDNLIGDLNGNDWDYSYRTKRRLQLFKGKQESWILFLRFVKRMSSKRESEIFNEERRDDQNMCKNLTDEIANSIDISEFVLKTNQFGRWAVQGSKQSWQSF